MTEELPAPPDPLPELADGDVLGWWGPCLRIYRQVSPHGGRWSSFRTAGPVATCRFDPHRAGVERGVQYVALGGSPTGVVTVVAEAFGDTRVIDRAAGTPALVVWVPTRTLRLLDLRSGWTTRAGGNQAIGSGPRAASRRWARAIHDAYPHLDGVASTPSTYGPGRAAALFTPAADALPDHPELHRRLDDATVDGLLARVAAELGYLVT